MVRRIDRATLPARRASEDHQVEKLKENFRRMELFGSEFGEAWLRFSWVISPHQEAAGATVGGAALSPR